MKIIESPRDGFQGIKDFIPTKVKIEYINLLLHAGFDTVEVGSFVSEKAIPQMRDTAEVLGGLDLTRTTSKIMVLAGNSKGAQPAAEFSQVDDIIYPFSVSPTFLRKNINSDFEKSKTEINKILEICFKYNKRLIVYLTMGFGNPYGDPWSPGIVEEWTGYLYNLGQRIIPLSDILGNVTPEIITSVYSRLIKSFPDVEFGIHLHAHPGIYYDKVDAAYKCGVRRFDSVVGGIGGCPMADDELVGNLNTFDLIEYCEKSAINHSISLPVLRKARNFKF